MAVIAMVLAGLFCIAAAIVAPEFLLGMGARLWLGGFGTVILILSAVLVVVTRLYQKAAANRAFVRTGQGGEKVVLDGGAIVIPVLHNIIPVSLETMRLNVERRGPHALITRDNLRVDLSAEFYIKVQPAREDILQAARSLGGRSITPGAVSELVQEKLVSALRTVAARMDLIELHGKRDEFAGEVQKIVTHELGANGLTLETVTISALDQTDTKSLSESNVFDAQGLRKIAEITQSARVQRNRIERESEQAVVGKDVETRKQVLDLERDQAEFEAEQRMKVANVQAARAREIQEFKIAQEEAVSRREIDKKRMVETADVQRTQAVEQATVDKQIALVAKARERETAEIEKMRAVEVTEREKEVAIALKEAERAAAQAKMLTADAERAAAHQRVLTVDATAQAEREAAKALIAAKQTVEQEKIRDQTAADVLAYTQVTQAEGERKAAEMQYEAKLRLAEGDAQAAVKKAGGDKAQKMVDVEVERERVDVERAKVEVERTSLANKQEFEGAALRFELDKLRIDADKVVRMAMAQSISQIMHGANVQLFGDPNTMSNMMQSFMRAASWGNTADGLLSTIPTEAREMLSKLGTGVGDVVGRTLAKNGEGASDGDKPTAAT